MRITFRGLLSSSAGYHLFAFWLWCGTSLSPFPNFLVVLAGVVDACFSDMLTMERKGRKVVDRCSVSFVVTGLSLFDVVAGLGLCG